MGKTITENQREMERDEKGGEKKQELSLSDLLSIQSNQTQKKKIRKEIADRGMHLTRQFLMNRNLFFKDNQPLKKSKYNTICRGHICF